MSIVIAYGFRIVMVLARCLALAWFTISWIGERKVNPYSGLQEVNDPTKKKVKG